MTFRHDEDDLRQRPKAFEWQTLGLIFACYGVWAMATTWLASFSLPLAVLVVALALVLHSSLQHEVIHGHPLANRILSIAMVFPALGFAIPYLRFRDMHLAHHMDSILTDPYDDPESNYLDNATWKALPSWTQALLRLNNTLAGRMLIGPLVSQLTFMAQDWVAVKSGNRRVMLGWVLHVPACMMVVWWLATTGQMPWWAYALGAYAALSILKIRTFLEHRAYEKARGRTVVVEDTGLLALLFLNNNYHVVHHMHPKVPWYKLRELYRKNRKRYLQRNEGYRYASYGEVFRQYFLNAKDPVPHPLWRR